jgi:RNA polymerase-binding transcription factor DksA
MDIAERHERELEETTARLKQDVSLALLDDGVYAVADPRGIVDEIDGAQRSVEQEMTLATRSRLRERANRLIGALERLRSGRYGLCEECDGPIAPARLAALPEVTTCLPCQSALELGLRPGDDEPESLFTDDLD